MKNTKRAVGFVCGVFLVGAACHLTPAQQAAVVASEKAACAIAKAELSDVELQAACDLTDAEMPEILKVVTAHRQKMAALRQQMKSCGPSLDAGLLEGGSR